ncbi:MAG: hypothetical protein AB1896_22120 [Thermodesulfobacteriota bacterium]
MDARDLIRRGQRAALLEKISILEAQIGNACAAITVHSYDGLGIENVDADKVLQAAQDLKAAKDEWARLKAQLEAL